MIGFGDRADFRSNHCDQFRFQFFRRFDPDVQSNIRVYALAFDVMRVSDHGGFSHVLMQHKRAFNLGRSQTVSRNVQHIVDSPRYPIVSVGIANAPVTCEVEARILAEICLHKSLMIPVDRAHLAGPTILDA